jgi:formate hydrogenlyase transcriptional activator
MIFNNPLVSSHGSQDYDAAAECATAIKPPSAGVLYFDAAARPQSAEGVVGNSDVLAGMVAQIEMVAPTGTTVLVEGETGTGKELVAHAIHRLSVRSSRAFIKMNCAAIPASLLESELFGHEKGAFTGAWMRRAGRFETAHGGTLFLDEIGDMPVELQAKLLRVLQEHEFERLGSSSTVKVDVRVIAATNQDLALLVEEKKFRADLFYRLNVFPISVPPLRQRVKDIPLLVEHFIGLLNQRMDKQITCIPSGSMEALIRYRWPGNIRELQNVIERSVVQTPGHVLRLCCLPVGGRPEPVTLEDAEREHILKALSLTNWVVGGPRGAAARLGMKRTTLVHTMRRRGISRDMAFGAAEAGSASYVTSNIAR